MSENLSPRPCNLINLFMKSLQAGGGETLLNTVSLAVRESATTVGQPRQRLN